MDEQNHYAKAENLLERAANANAPHNGIQYGVAAVGHAILEAIDLAVFLLVQRPSEGEPDA